VIHIVLFRNQLGGKHNQPNTNLEKKTGLCEKAIPTLLLHQALWLQFQFALSSWFSRDARGARESISLSVFCAPHQIKLSYLNMTIRWRVSERERTQLHCVLAALCVLMLQQRGGVYFSRSCTRWPVLVQRKVEDHHQGHNEMLVLAAHKGEHYARGEPTHRQTN
jgi:hypothetical protein